MKKYASMILIVTASIAFYLTAQAGELPESKPQQRTKAAAIIKVFALKYSDVSEAIDSIREFQTSLSDAFRMSADARTNSIIAIGIEKDLKFVETFLAKIDVAVTEAKKDDSAEVLRILSVDAKVMDKSFLTILDDVFGHQFDFSIDEARNKIVVNADAKSIDAMESFLREYEQLTKATNPEPAITKVRLYWLVSADKEGGSIPEELNEVIQELEKLKMGNLRVATQMNILASDNFEISSSSQIDEDITLEFDGQLEVSNPDRRNAIININAQRITEKKNDGGAPSRTTSSLGHISTTINVPLGHFVVLGTTSIQKRNSVFVLQFLPAK